MIMGKKKKPSNGDIYIYIDIDINSDGKVV